MKLIEALEMLRRPVDDASPRLRVLLACGITPLHLETFLAAHIRSLFPGVRVEIRTGRFGDLIGNIERQNPSEIDCFAVPIEWSDLDPRLGVRTLGGWRPSDLVNIVQCAQKAAARIRSAMVEKSAHVPTVVSMPTLPLPPMFPTKPTETSRFEAQILGIAESTAEYLSRAPGVRMANAQFLGLVSPPADRYDLKSDLTAGFPYSLDHASALAEVLAGMIQERPPMKGLITDLDETLWAGILGDDGIDGVSWDLDRHTHMHGLYQQFLSSLAGAGVLIGVASKNDAALVERAFERKDILLSKKDIFPFEVHWSRKSESVRRILRVWNIGADSVIFVDDNAMEIAEVKSAFPEMECRLFPKGNYQAVWKLLQDLRTAFGKPQITQEDELRLASIRASGAWRDEGAGAQDGSDDFMRSAEASIVFECGQASESQRAFELVNKTNQFNLNGKRLSKSEWAGFSHDSPGFVLTASYKDKYGPLGMIAVVMGKINGGKAHVSTWVMSCRAFSRRIEYQCLKYLFDNLGADEVTFDYQITDRNGPMHEFLSEMLQAPPACGMSLTRTEFVTRTPPLFHCVEVAAHA